MRMCARQTGRFFSMKFFGTWRCGGAGDYLKMQFSNGFLEDAIAEQSDCNWFAFLELIAMTKFKWFKVLLVNSLVLHHG